MRKIIIPFIIIISLVIISLLFFMPKQKKVTNEEKETNEPITEVISWKKQMKQKYPYFIDDYEQRYKSYQVKHPDLNEEDVITYVNIGLDNEFYTNTKPASYQQTNQVLVNKYHYLEKDYIPNHLEPLDSNYAKDGIFLVKEAKEALEQLIQNTKENGYTIHVTSAYRSYEYQFNLYNQYVKSDGKALSDTYSARPGFSEHQTGLVVDLDNTHLPYTSFEQTKEYQWMLENAHRFGFILRFPKDKEHITGYQFESWHYRYVGKELAMKIKTSNLTFEEYYARYLDENIH